MPLCLTFIDLKKTFDSVETEAVLKALDNQGIPTHAAVENAMRGLEWDDTGVQQLHEFRHSTRMSSLT
ncbi:hypothetical protein RB195_010492 [Necator americanus]|uniref:Reverse transcriptase domain-containing protein n=1 Tax=Necator americanus TaxID=51031 RepID=A0ABR1CY67_NECAM